MSDPAASDEARLRQVFDAAVRGAIFPPVPTGDRLLVLLGGQPAATGRASGADLEGWVL